MTDPADLRPSQATGPEMVIQQAEIACPEFNRFLYTAVGGNWYWTFWLGRTYQQWMDFLNRPEVETWVGYVQGTPAGYFELEKQPEANVEIVHFGLLPRFIGQGLGGRLLTRAIQRAWEMGARRVWVHTCTLDGPAALSNYQARGLRLYKQEVREEEIPDQPPGPWPGACAVSPEPSTASA
ncbi:MAG TPA: GNAT family N-acetyltransferase [Chthonomonadaceae bacterium]|nr:GNAT family N-acetyltransferase [Chthonomonadaceae bacterium]